MSKSNSKQTIAVNGEQLYTIYVGKAFSECFSVDKDLETLLRAASPFFAAKFHEQKRLIKLPTFDPQDFRSYKDWLHTRRASPHRQADFIESRCENEWGHICQAYVLGERLQDYSYCNVMVDVLAKKSSTASDQSVKDILACVENVFTRTARTSPIRNLLIDTVYSRIFSTLPDAECMTRLEALPMVPQFTAGLFMRKGKSIKPQWSDPCQYHRHDRGEPCFADTEPSIWKDMRAMFHDWCSFICTNAKGISDSYQAFRPCVSSTYTVLKKLGTKCTAAFSWCRALVKAHL
ncbi:uncharacterized protein CC84DRAFT_1255607 [Paraphaeosphaeria sporulosa]|uniref:BTB domain-containing protein n=1 Tax=Paraphaeosphaeria sporulosa TaxID=1460663 RepID=A0A177CRS7_9PLEO|nr:uncharacterized protein CC84DRAFT_1255607 [Paraphaeosphaeria sporulosa]OAG09590.1 hypothetical protein CC84DRAFT_1255607 [Paraphaeosphaeria sporulosa]